MQKHYASLLNDDLSVIPALVNAQIRNTAAADELDLYERERRFVYKHPIANAYRVRMQYAASYEQKSPEDIYRDITNNASYIRKVKAKIAHLEDGDIKRLTELQDALQVAENKRVALLEMLKKIS